MNDLQRMGENQLAQQGSAMIEAATAREAQEVQAAMVVAKRFPRDEITAENRILKACQRVRLAEASTYRYSRGGTNITGPSIRLAEAMAQNWGNMVFGVKELSQQIGADGKKESVVCSYAWDLETNTRMEKVFTVKHWRDTKQGGYALESERDVYELIANMGARRLRACILGIIPGDIQDSALAQCNKTLLSDNSEPLIDKIKKMVRAFEETFQVTKEMLEERLQHKIEASTPQECVGLRNIWQSLKDGQGKREDFFNVAPLEDDTTGNPSELTAGKKKASPPKRTQTQTEKPAPAQQQEEETGELASDVQIDQIKQIAIKKLTESNQPTIPANIEKLIVYACGSTDIKVSNPLNPTKAEVKPVISAIDAMTIFDTTEAVTG